MTRLFLVGAIVLTLLYHAPAVRAQEEGNNIPDETQILEESPHVDPVPDQFIRARVQAVTKDETVGSGSHIQRVQEVTLKLLSGPDAGDELLVEHGKLITLRPEQAVKVGEVVVVTKTETLDGPTYYVADKYRIPSVMWLLAGFFVLVVFFGRMRGLTSVLGLAVSGALVVMFLIPKIINGADPLLMSLIGAVVIAISSLYIAHGVSRRTTVALISTLITLGLATGLAFLATSITRLSGTGSDEAFYLQLGSLGTINMHGLFLGGIIIGALGVLDDITTAQSATVDELKKANPTLGMAELYRRGLSVGREHIASLVNTLVLAYAGASFPLLLLFSAKDAVPFWVNFNSEFVIEEVVRTVVGSAALVLAVPLATVLAAWTLTRTRKRHV